jgi:hypothetical protein
MMLLLGASGLTTAAADVVKIKVGVVTWNLAETKQGDDAVADLIQGAKLGDCDIIVVGEQETAKKGGYLSQRIAEKLGKNWFWADPKGKGNNCRTDIGASFKTATATVGSRKLHIGVVWNKRVNTWKLKFDTDVSKGKRKKLVFYTAKGGAIVYMELGERRLGFVSCHLNDESTKNRDAEIDAIMATVDKSDCDGVYLMGDLNYRPTDYDDTLEVAEGSDLPTASAVCKALVTDLRGFYEKFDPFGRKESALRRKHGFDCMVTDFLPTYKRHMGKKAEKMPDNPDFDDLLDYYDFPGVDGDGKPAKKDKDVLVRVAGEIKKKRRAQNEFAIGWLDRIAFKDDGEGDVKIKWIEYDALHNVGDSDHAPVFLITELEMDLEKPEK